MNTYTVYHRKSLLDVDSFKNTPSTTQSSLEHSHHPGAPREGQAISKLHWPEDYRLVASVEAENLDEVNVKTQHSEKEWWKNPGVELLAKSRSTSVSDIIIGSDRHVMVVMPIGFADLSEEMGYRILTDAEEAFGIRSLILERTASGNWPRPVSIPEYLLWLEDEARLQARQLYADILFFRQQEAYVRALFGVAMELRSWGFTPALPPWATFTLINTESVCIEREGEFPLLPAEAPHTFGSLQDAALALAELTWQNGHSLDTLQIYTLEPVSKAKVLAVFPAVAAQPEMLANWRERS
jgi:hypothetical protein